MTANRERSGIEKANRGLAIGFLVALGLLTVAEVKPAVQEVTKTVQDYQNVSSYGGGFREELSASDKDGGDALARFGVIAAPWLLLGWGKRRLNRQGWDFDKVNRLVSIRMTYQKMVELGLVRNTGGTTGGGPATRTNPDLHGGQRREGAPASVSRSAHPGQQRRRVVSADQAAAGYPDDQQRAGRSGAHPGRPARRPVQPGQRQAAGYPSQRDDPYAAIPGFEPRQPGYGEAPPEQAYQEDPGGDQLVYGAQQFWQGNQPVDAGSYEVGSAEQEARAAFLTELDLQQEQGGYGYTQQY